MRVRILSLGLFGLLAGIAAFKWYLSEEAAEDPPSATIKEQLETSAVPSQQIEKPDQLTGASRETMLEIFGRFQAGDYGAALELADRALQSDGLDPLLLAWISRQLPNILIANGWLHLQGQRCSQAISLLRRADGLGDFPLVKKGLGICYYREQQFGPAEEALKTFLSSNNKDASTRVVLSDILESQQRYKEAAHQLQLILKETPSEDLEKRYQAMLIRAKEGTQQTTTTSMHFQVTYRALEHDEIVNEVIAILESAVDEFIEVYGFDPPTSVIEVVLYPSSGFGSATNSPDWARGLFDGRLRIPIYSNYYESEGSEQLARVLRHELAHAMLSHKTNARELPAWFNEGIAQRLECKTECERALFPATPGKFLEPSVLEMPYTSYQAVQAEQSYRQSLYMILTLENLESLYGTDPLFRIIRNLRKTGKASSDRILSSVSLGYSSLHDEAKARWERRHRF